MIKKTRNTKANITAWIKAKAQNKKQWLKEHPGFFN
jgi:hypothetical protein